LNQNLDILLAQTESVMRSTNGHGAHISDYHVGVDLGTAYTVLVVLDQNNQPIAGSYRFANVVRDGLVVDFVGAIDLLRELKRSVESRLGFVLTHAATGFPPGVPRTEVRATANVVRAAGFDCRVEVDEPTAANAVLGLQDGVVVDVGGGTTGIAIVRDGRVVFTADEATGGTHFTLVVAGALKISVEEAEKLKIDPREHDRLYPLVRPVMEKVGTIVRRHISAYDVDAIYMVGGTSNFKGIAQVVQEMTDVRTFVPVQPLFVTPLGIAMNDIIK
jgi:ethanolamine utilization protein EutJ